MRRAALMLTDTSPFVIIKYRGEVQRRALDRRDGIDLKLIKGTPAVRATLSNLAGAVT